MTDRTKIPKGKYSRTGYVSPIDAALEIIGGKYKVAILYYIRESVLRFGELRRLMPLATKRVLICSTPVGRSFIRARANTWSPWVFTVTSGIHNMSDFFDHSRISDSMADSHYA